MKIQKKPWQVAPSDFIAHAIEHANLKTDFDKQMAFLVLDIGIETTLKIFLDKYKHKEYKKIQKEAAKNGREVSFYSIVTEVKRLTSGEIPELDPDEINGFHEQRNALYHGGTRLNPPDADLERYIDIAKTLLKALLDFDVEEINANGIEAEAKRKYSFWNEDWKSDCTIDEVVPELSTRLRYFHESCALIVEQLHPSFATRKFALELQKVWEDTLGQMYTDDPTIRTVEDAMELTHFTEERLRQFNEVAKKYIEHQDLKDFGLDVASDISYESDRDFVDSILMNVNYLYVWLVLQDFSKNGNEEWSKYQHIARTISHLPEQWILSLNESRLDIEKVAQEYKEMNSWIVKRQNALDKWFMQYMPDFQRPDINLLFIPIVFNLD